MTGIDLKRSWKKNVELVDESAGLLLNNQQQNEESGFDDCGGGSFHGSVFNLSCNIVGSGIMSLPAALKLLGIVPGVALIKFAELLTDASIDMLLRFSKPGSSISYGDVMNEAFGKFGRILLQATVFIASIGALIVFMIIIEDVLSGSDTNGVHHAGVLEGWFGGGHWWIQRNFVILFITVLVFIPLICFKRIDSLKYTSAISVSLAVLFLIVLMGVTVYKLLEGSIGTPIWFPSVPDLASFWKLFTAIPILVCVYVCHYNVHTIQNELNETPQMQAVVQTSLVLCACVYVMTGVFGFLLFGEDTLSNVLSNFDTEIGVPYGSLLNDVARISYAGHIILIFPIIFFPLRLNLDGLFFPSARSLDSDYIRFASLSIGLIATILLGAILIPDIWIVFEFAGGTVGVLLAFVFPASLTLKDSHGIATRKDKILAVFMIIIAVFTNLVAVCSDIYSLLTEAGEVN